VKPPGVGGSSVPWAIRYSTSEMAKDVRELCDSLGWNQKKQLHVIGVSLGGCEPGPASFLLQRSLTRLRIPGMIAQEL